MPSFPQILLLMASMAMILASSTSRAETLYRWSGEVSNGTYVDSEGNRTQIVNPAVRISPRTSHLNLGDEGGDAKVLSEITSRDIFEGLGLRPYTQDGGTCVGHAFGILLDYEMILSGLAAPGKRVIDQQLYTQFLQQRFNEVYGGENPDFQLNFPSGAIYLGALYDPVKINGEYHVSRSEIGLSHGSVEGVLNYIKKFPKICRLDLNATDRGSAESLVSSLEELNRVKDPIPLNPQGRVARSLERILEKQGRVRSEVNQTIEQFGTEYKNPFEYVNKTLFPECSSQESQVDVSSILNRLYTVQRGQQILRNNGAFEDFLSSHFSDFSARPVMVAVCESYRDDFYLEKEPQIAINRDEVISFTYRPEQVSAYPYAEFGRNDYTPPEAKTQACNKYKIGHAFVIKGKRVVELPDGSRRTDYLIEDSRRGPEGLFMWAGAGEYHFWMDAKTLVENTTSATFFTDEVLN